MQVRFDVLRFWRRNPMELTQNRPDVVATLSSVVLYAQSGIADRERLTVVDRSTRYAMRMNPHDREAQGDLGLAADPLPPTTARILKFSSQIAERPAERPDFLHAGLCQVGLPRSQVKELTFERTSGKASLLLEAGKLWDGTEWIQQPLPYGTRPRLALVHVSTEAIRTRNPAVDVGHSAREFLIRLGIDTGGKEYRSFSAQMRALAACHMSLGYGQDTLSAKPIKRFTTWNHQPDAAGSLMPGTIELTPEFYESLTQFAVPLDPRALAALKHSALALDVYAWLAHRLHRVRPASGTFLSWENLRQQFGQEYGEIKDFKREMNKTLRLVHAVYLDARIEKVHGGLKLLPSPSPIPKTTVIVPRLSAPPS
jgi:Plasmid encoded RepA protein